MFAVKAQLSSFLQERNEAAENDLNHPALPAVPFIDYRARCSQTNQRKSPVHNSFMGSSIRIGMDVHALRGGACAELQQQTLF